MKVECAGCRNYSLCGCPVFGSHECFDSTESWWKVQESYCNQHQRADGFIYCDDCVHGKDCPLRRNIHWAYTEPHCQTFYCFYER